MFPKTTLIGILLVAWTCSGSNVQDSEFDEFVEYVSEYINFTNHYTFNEDNSDLYETTDQTEYDYGTFDFIIVGGGCAGTLLTRRLSEVSDWKILLIEAGGVMDRFTEIPFMNAYTYYSPFNWGYKTTPQENSCQGMADKRCSYPRGRGLGGTEIIGHSSYVRGNRADFDAIASLGLEGWSYEEVLPYFKKTEMIQIASYDKGYHGHDGPLKVNKTSSKSSTHDYYLKAAKLAGQKSTDYNGENQLGISNIQVTIDFNKKLTGGNAFILPILDTTPNLNLTTHSFATKILFTDNTATGVQFIKNGKKYKATATKEVIMSSGAINSPQILMLSGVGPKEDLEALNIEVVKDLPVGQHLIDHPVYVGLYVRTNLTTDKGNLSDNLQRWIDGLGYFTTTFSADNIQFINTKNPGVEPPNIEYINMSPPTSLPAGTFYNLNEDYTKVFESLNTLTDLLVYTIGTHPKSRGSVKLSSNSPVDFPLINPGFYTDKDNEDIEEIYEGVQYVLNLIKSEPLQAINATLVETAPDCEYLKEESEKAYWFCAIKSLTSTFYQVGGTTRMGLNESESVIDGRLKVHGVKNLRVVDYGSYPITTRGHATAAVYLLAEKAADLIKQEYLG